MTADADRARCSASTAATLHGLTPGTQCLRFVQYGSSVVSEVHELAGGLLALSDRGAGVPLRELALVGLTAAIITYFATGWVRVLATRLGAVAYPRERDVHVQPTPRMGGLAMYIGVLAAVLLASQLPALTRGFVYSSGMPAVVVAGGLIMAIGLIDDRWGLDALTKFAGQITAASVLVTMGVAWSVLYIPFGGVGTIVLDQVSSILLTLALTVAIVNAMNFVDGLDGLAAGLGLITALAICIFSIGLLRDHGGDVLFYPPAVISVVLAGACLGFLPHNFHRARIFMGDSGSMLIGLMLGRGLDHGGRPDLAERLRRPRRVRAAVSVPAGGRGHVRARAGHAAGHRPAHPRGPQPVQSRQDASASPTAADRPLAPTRGAADLSLGGHRRVGCREHDLLRPPLYRRGDAGRDSGRDRGHPHSAVCGAASERLRRVVRRKVVDQFLANSCVVRCW